MIRMRLGDADDSGRRRPVPIAGSEFVIDCDMVLPAIGQVASSRAGRADSSCRPAKTVSADMATLADLRCEACSPAATWSAAAGP